MDLISLALQLFLHNPEIALAGSKEITRPGTVDMAQMQESFADLSRGILNCYHRTARFREADLLEKPWGRQAQYGADHSALIQIQYAGITRASYKMQVVVMTKGGQIRTQVLHDSAIIPFNKKCQLENWTRM